MYLSLDWLKDYVDVSKITPEELGLKLTMHTVEIDEVINQADQFNKVVVGKVLEVKKHPGADRLNLAKVDVSRKEPLDIVCGASNLKKEQLVPVALVGAVLPGDFKIEAREVRGEKSEGMICAEDELGLGEDHEGIMVLEKKAKIGQNFGDYLKLQDVIFDVDNKSITNRPDLWGHLGMAREIAVFLDSKNTKKFNKILENKLKNDESLEEINVKVEDKDLCPRYMAVKVDGVEVKESPEWIKKRLQAIGMRPINNIVDATNYAMIELGQPMHAFDSKKVSEIIVRRAKKDEKIKTLDGAERKLDNEMLVIADSKNIIAIAGVMGGENSEISNETSSIILESANFEPISVRKTSTKLGLRSEASTRFEKSLDPNMCEIALARAVELLKETCPKVKVSSQVADEADFNLNQGPIEIGLDWINKRLGEKIKEDKIINILTRLGFGVEVKEGNILNVSVPTWRATKDIDIKEDVLEEVARIYGYDNLKPKMPLVALDAPRENKERSLERKIKNILSFGAGLNETYNYSFLGEEKLKKLKIDSSEYIKLKNPISNVHTILRQNLFVNMIDNVKVNQAKYEEIRFFEIGSIFLNNPGTINKDKDKKDNLPYQEKHLAILEAGSDVYEKVKGKLEYLFDSLSISFKYEPAETTPDWSLKSSFAKIKIENNGTDTSVGSARGEEIGFVSEIDKKILSSLGVKKDVAVVEVSFDKIFKTISSLLEKKYKEANKFPKAERDLAFVVDSKVLYNKIKAEIEEFNELIFEVELFDVYEGDKIGSEKRSLAFHITYLSNEKTLKSEEVDELQKKLIKNLENKFEAKIRDF